MELATVANQQMGFAGAGSHRNPWHSAKAKLLLLILWDFP